MYFLIPTLESTVVWTEFYRAIFWWTGNVLSMLNCIKKENIWWHKGYIELEFEKQWSQGLKKAMQELNSFISNHASSYNIHTRGPEVLAWHLLYSLWHVERCPWKSTFQISQCRCDQQVWRFYWLTIVLIPCYLLSQC